MVCLELGAVLELGLGPVMGMGTLLELGLGTVLGLGTRLGWSCRKASDGFMAS